MSTVSAGMVSQSDLAKQLGVNKSTVARALGNHPSISVEMRDKVRALARELGYRRNPHLAAIAAHRWKKPHNVSGARIAIISELRDGVHQLDAPMETQIRASLRERGYEAEFHEVVDAPAMRRLSRNLYQRGVDGILVTHLFRHELYEAFDWSLFSVVHLRLGGTLPLPFDQVGSDRVQTVQRAWHQLVRAGCRRPGLIIFDEDAEKDEIYRSGAFLFLQQQAADPDPLPVLAMKWEPQAERWKDPGGMIEQTRAWLDRYQPDGVLGENEAFYYVMKAAGVRIPREVKFVALIKQTEDRKIAGFTEQYDPLYEHAAHLLDQRVRVSERGLPALPLHLFVPQVWSAGQSLPQPQP